MIGRAHLGERQVAGIGDLHQPRIERAVEAERLPELHRAIGERELDGAIGLAGHVGRGQHIAVLADDHAAPLGPAHLHADRALHQLVGQRADVGLHRLEVGQAHRRAAREQSSEAFLGGIGGSGGGIVGCGQIAGGNRREQQSQSQRSTGQQIPQTK